MGLEIKNLSFWYKNAQKASLDDINLSIKKGKVTALIGPSGCGKSTLLRCINRIHDLYPGNKYSGEILYNNENILSSKYDVILLRMQIAMIFQKPTPFHMSIKKNVEYGLKMQGEKDKTKLALAVQDALKRANLWDEVKDRLDASATTLSGGQAQRLCIARAIATKPKVLLFDEPTSALDPLSTSAIEELILSLRDKFSIVIVTHNMSQAMRISDFSAFMYLGKLIEFGKTKQIFTNPKQNLLRDYVGGKFG